MTMMTRPSRLLVYLSALVFLLAGAACGDDDDDSDVDGGVVRRDGGPTSDDGAVVRRDGGPRPSDGGTFTGLTLNLEWATPEQIGLYLVADAPPPEGSAVTVRYKDVADADWRQAHPLLRVHPEWSSSGAPEPVIEGFAGTIFDLSPGLSYDVELTLSVPGVADELITTIATTRALPAAPGAPTVTATAADDLQAIFDALEPGDVLELADGAYDATGLHLDSAGTEAMPIYIRGASREGVVLSAASGRVLQLQGASHVILENLTMEGSGTDSGTDASSVAVSFWNGALQEYVTFRDLDIRGVDKGIIASGKTHGILVYNCTFRGNNVWNAEFVESNRTWNDDAIRLPGEGNCAWENTLHGFGDSFAVDNGTHSAAVYYYRNRITMTGDDSFEGDYGTRNLAFYDNYISNASTLLSLDPLWGGPLYCFRNVIVNVVRGPFKLNDTNTGFMIYNNTIVRTEGTTDWGWVQFNNGDLRAWSYRNNVLVYRGASGKTLAIESGGNDPIDFTHNAWFPDGSVWWTTTGGSWSSFEAARSGVPATSPLFGTSTMRHEFDVLLTDDPFTSSVTLGADHLTEITTEMIPSLAAGSPAQGAGIAIPNVTDGYSGAAPDMGALIAGRPTPRWGATRP